MRGLAVRNNKGFAKKKEKKDDRKDKRNSKC